MQAPKRVMQELTRRESRESRSRWKMMSEWIHRSCRGIGDGMQTKGIRRNTGSPSGDRSGDQPATRKSQAGPTGVAERPAVCAEQRVAQEGSSPSGARMRSAISEHGGNASWAGEGGGYGEA